MHTQKRLAPEWADIDAVILAWPHRDTDWAPWLEQARQTYLNLIQAINHARAGVILLCSKDDIESVATQLSSDARVLLVPADFNDTWVRDYGFLTVVDENALGHPVEFTFNGWGEKFDACADNQVNSRYLSSLCKQPLTSISLVAEGGALEIDGNGVLLSTKLCLTNPKRNGDLSLEAYAEVFSASLGCSKVIIFEHGHLEGDDTDGHIDTLVRFTPNTGLVLQGAKNRKDDSHFAGLEALSQECTEKLPEHRQFHLPLPFIESEDGDRLPASYANYLICNGNVLLPIYGQPEDAEAISTVEEAYPHFNVVPVDCSVLVQQYGSLHCISMQVPKNTLTSETLSCLNQGVSIHATINP